MSETSIQPATEPRVVAPPADPAAIATAPAVSAVPPASQPRPKNPALKLLKVLASLRLTVVLFVLSFLLVFLATVAQKDASVNAIIDRYFRCLVAWVPLQVFARFLDIFFLRVMFDMKKELVFSGSFPFPGGFLLGGLLLVNLLAAHLVRFKVGWKRTGILMIHAGLVLMLLGEFYRMQFAVEGNMTISRGATSNYLEHRDRFELVFRTPSKEDPDKYDVVVVPGSMLSSGAKVKDDRLPVDIEVNDLMPNSLLGVVRGSETARMMAANGALSLVKEEAAVPETVKGLANAGLSSEIFGIPKPQGTGVETDSRHDVPSAYVTFKDKKTGKVLGSYFVSVWFPELEVPAQELKFAGDSCEVGLRFKRTYKPYSITLDDVRAVYYPGTNTPKDYSSDIRIRDDDQSADVAYKIYMNQPLRYRGEAFFQSGVNPQQNPSITVLQVVKNESWLLPYISCVVVGLGMVIHFGLNLSNFLKRRAVA